VAFLRSAGWARPRTARRSRLRFLPAEALEQARRAVSPALSLRPAARRCREWLGGLLNFLCSLCRLRSANRVGTGRSSGPRHAHSSRRPFGRPTPSLHSTPHVLVPPVPPVLHGGSAAPPASPPRGPASELCAFSHVTPETSPRPTARSSLGPASASRQSTSELHRAPRRSFRFPSQSLFLHCLTRVAADSLRSPLMPRLGRCANNAIAS
jgi:hypothetical protein